MQTERKLPHVFAASPGEAAARPAARFGPYMGGETVQFGEQSSSGGVVLDGLPGVLLPKAEP